MNDIEMYNFSEIKDHVNELKIELSDSDSQGTRQSLI